MLSNNKNSDRNSIHIFYCFKNNELCILLLFYQHFEISQNIFEGCVGRLHFLILPLKTFNSLISLVNCTINLNYIPS